MSFFEFDDKNNPEIEFLDSFDNLDRLAETKSNQNKTTDNILENSNRISNNFDYSRSLSKFLDFTEKNSTYKAKLFELEKIVFNLAYSIVHDEDSALEVVDKVVSDIKFSYPSLKGAAFEKEVHCNTYKISIDKLLKQVKEKKRPILKSKKKILH